MPSVIELNTYPIKGLSPQALENVMIEAGNGFPYDRFFGLARADSGFDPQNPQPLPKDRFFVLAQVEALATLQSEFDPMSKSLQLTAPGKATEHFDLSQQSDRQSLADFIAAFLKLSDEEKPMIAEAHPHRFTDVSVVSAEMMNAISLINLDSVRDFGQKIDSEINPLRFRGNILVEGIPPFSELDLVGKGIKIGDVAFEVIKRTKRCPATEVDPQTAVRDVKVPYLLRKHYGHFDMGVYISAISDGKISRGDTVTIS